MGLDAATAIVDIGCGTGYLMKRLMERFPGVAITGVEIDQALVDRAKQMFIQRGGPKPLIVNGSIQKTTLPDSAFDVAVSRLVLEHLSDPLEALREVRRILKPDGRIIMIDNDFDFHLRTWPPVPELDTLYSAYCAAREKDGGHPRIGRQLPVLLRQAGFSQVNMEILFAHSADQGDEPFLKSEGSGIPAQLVRSGFLDQSILASMSKRWVNMLHTEGHAIVRQLFYATGIKKGDGADESKINHASAEANRTAINVAAVSSSPLTTIRKFAATVLGVGEADLNDSLPLIQLGLDSIGAVELQDALKTDCNVDIPVGDILSTLSIKDIAARIESRKS